jgi:crotonobetainyl-CoA:carnitine CoA-transferase CaiB-like acyl-CoA transferase
MSKSTKAQQGLQRPLEGIRIVEYGVFHAGPGGNAILGDLGAEIIKIETSSGDPERYWTKVAGSDFSLKNGESLIFEASNRNKKGICLDIRFTSVPVRREPEAQHLNWGNIRIWSCKSWVILIGK